VKKLSNFQYLLYQQIYFINKGSCIYSYVYMTSERQYFVPFCHFLFIKFTICKEINDQVKNVFSFEEGTLIHHKELSSFSLP